MTRLEDRLAILAEEMVFGSDADKVLVAVRVGNPDLPVARATAEARLAEICADLLDPASGAEPVDLETESFRRLRDELLPNWTSPLLALNLLEWNQRQGKRLFVELRSLFRAHVHFPEEWEFDLVCLYVFQCYLADLLPAYFYALIDGTKGAGKTTLLDHISRVTDSLRLQSFTLATLSRSITKYRSVSIDEFDITEKNPEMGSATAALVRQGYKWDAAPRLICAPRSNEVLKLEVAGPKAITFRYELDDALKDRGFRFPMASGNNYRLVVLGMAPEFGDIAARLQAWAEEGHKLWSYERVCSRIKEPSFETRVRKGMGSPAATRGAELMTTATVVSEVAGVDVSDALQAATGARERESTASSGVEELTEALRTIAARDGPKLVEATHLQVAQTAVRAEIDRARKDRRVAPLKDGEFAQLRRDALIHDDWRVTIRGKAYWKVPVDFLALDRPSDPPEGPEPPSRQDDRVPRVARVAHSPDAVDPGSEPAEPGSWTEPPVHRCDRSECDPGEGGAA